MGITRRFGRIGSVLLPVALLAVFFKYLHPLNSILHGVEGWGARKMGGMDFHNAREEKALFKLDIKDESAA
jgi:hypothetical protein